MDVTSDIARNVSRLAVAFVPMLLGIILHEIAHGWAAWKLGDPTARLQGRLTLNPLRHLDVTGSLLFVLTALLSPFIFGWAKPVPVQPRYFKNPRQGMMITSLAGPAANFLLALVFGGLYAVMVRGLMTGYATDISAFTRFALNATFIGMWINVTLGWFNLLPIPGFDGGHILAGFLPYSLAEKFYRYSRYGMVLLVLLLATGTLRYILGPLVTTSVSLIGGLFAIPPQLL